MFKAVRVGKYRKFGCPQCGRPALSAVEAPTIIKCGGCSFIFGLASDTVRSRTKVRFAGANVRVQVMRYSRRGIPGVTRQVLSRKEQRQEPQQV